MQIKNNYTKTESTGPDPSPYICVNNSYLLPHLEKPST